ncbi:MAG: hypothetical protein MRY63_10055 [Neomegalonema sp.]|nr:hypothetical protein [Neomegalonema sp.]
MFAQNHAKVWKTVGRGMLCASVLGLMGCAGGDGQSRAAAGFLPTQSPALETASIDPTYAISPERSAQATSDPQTARFTAEAAQIAMREGKVGGAAVHLSKLYDQNPRDKQITYDYARHLRYSGFLSVAKQVLGNGLAIHPQDPLLLLELAKVHIAAGEPSEALMRLQVISASRGKESPGKDPSVLQTKGVALDRMGRHAEAQEAYHSAMTLDRPSASLLNNLGMSYLLSGDSEKAEEVLRQATVAHGAGPQVQQNLAMAMTLNGKEAEAESIARSATPAGLGQQALDYARGLIRRDHAWTRAAQPGG